MRRGAHSRAAARTRLLAEIGDWMPRAWLGTRAVAGSVYADLLEEGVIEEQRRPGHVPGSRPIWVRRRPAQGAA